MELFRITTSECTNFSGDDILSLRDKIDILEKIIKDKLESFKDQKTLEFVGDPRSIFLLEISQNYRSVEHPASPEDVWGLGVYKIGDWWCDSLQKHITVNRSLHQEERHIICNGGID